MPSMLSDRLKRTKLRGISNKIPIDLKSDTLQMCHKSYLANHLIFRIIFIIFQITKEFLGTQKPHIKCGFDAAQY